MATGAIYVELEPDLEFDHGVLESFPRWEPVKEGAVRFGPLPHRQVCYGAVVEGLPPRPPELWFTDLSEFYREILSKIVDGSWKGFDYELDEQQRRTPTRRSRTPERSSLRPTSPGGNGPFPEPLFLGWEFHEIDTLVTEAIAEITLLIRNRHGVMNAPRSRSSIPKKMLALRRIDSAPAWNAPSGSSHCWQLICCRTSSRGRFKPASQCRSRGMTFRGCSCTTSPQGGTVGGVA